MNASGENLKQRYPIRHSLYPDGKTRGETREAGA